MVRAGVRFTDQEEAGRIRHVLQEHIFTVHLTGGRQWAAMGAGGRVRE